MPHRSSPRFSRRWLLTATAASAFLSGTAFALPKPDRGGVPENDLYDYGVMGPPATEAIVVAAEKELEIPLPAGPFRPDWASIAAHYHAPAWFGDAQFGIFIHWGLFSAAARRNEWYEKHMYAKAEAAAHAENFGPHEHFGYKDFIGKFTAARWDPDAWAQLFRDAGARYVIPTAQHHDNFALWDSQVTPFNMKAMGPKRDLIGELGVAVRKQGLRYGVSNHGVENFTFIEPMPELDARLKAAKADLYDPEWAGFYNVADRSPAAMSRFLTDWTRRNYELIDKYQPDILWFDNGVNLRVLDPLKRLVAAYYYNRASAWKKEVSIAAKFVAFAPSNDDTRQIGAIIDFEKVGKRSPAGIRPGPWMVDDNLTSTWGYTEGMTVTPADAIVRRLIDTVSKGGSYLLNIAPMADGTIPQTQQDVLREVGAWLSVNGEAVYGARPWGVFGEGENIRFTQQAHALYVTVLRPDGPVQIAALSTEWASVKGLTVLGQTEAPTFSQTAEGLTVSLPATSLPASSLPRVVRIDL